MTAMLSIIIPALDEEARIGECLARLQVMRRAGTELVVVDGGSRDATREAARAGADQVIESPRGRASQMNAGARAARGGTLLFLHADTLLPEGASAAIDRALRDRAWGRFDVRIAGNHPMLAVVATFMNARSRWTGIATGDQALFMRRAAFEQAGGYPAIPLMEDVAICKALKRVSKPACLRERVVTSGRRWEERGMLRTIVLMWRLRLAFALGADPARLARLYDGRAA
ncbi:glycosyl transferase [Betaproteobacteria bacterium GR16-43]|nr:glycosyl transferase [Betaproteobacteria bacterium GR16-43]